MKAYIPANFNPGSFKSPDKLYYILTLLYWGKVFNKIESDSFVPLSAKILQYIIWDYQTPLEYLLKNGVIESNNRYIIGQASKGFRLTPKYAKAGYRHAEINNKQIIKKISNYKNRQVKVMKAVQHLHIWNCLKQITIDSNGARKYIKSANLDAEKYFSYQIAVDMIEDGMFFQTVDTTAGRLHNNITNLSRQLRPYLRYRDNKLVEIDIANSQPFIFNVLINEALKNHGFLSTFKGIDKDINLSYVCGFRLYEDLTSSGKLYEYLMQKLGITEPRETFKVRFYKNVFFSKENPRYITTERKHFKELFPGVSEIISFYKREDYKQLAIRLQKAEADIMINSVAKELSEREIFFLTIHDSILTLAENAELVKEIISNEFQNNFGLKPTIKIK